MSKGKAMPLRAPTSAVVAIASLALLVSCDSSDDVEAIRPITPGLEVTISANRPATSPGNPVTLTVRTRNIGVSRIVWGHGSSSCQLHAVARVEGVDRWTVESRACIADVVEQGLDPGGVRTESFEWNGEVVSGMGSEALPPGAYEVRGAAGDALSAPVEIEVVRQPAPVVSSDGRETQIERKSVRRRLATSRRSSATPGGTPAQVRKPAAGGELSPLCGAAT